MLYDDCSWYRVTHSRCLPCIHILLKVLSFHGWVLYWYHFCCSCSSQQQFMLQRFMYYCAVWHTCTLFFPHVNHWIFHTTTLLLCNLQARCCAGTLFMFLILSEHKMLYWYGSTYFYMLYICTVLSFFNDLWWLKIQNVCCMFYFNTCTMHILSSCTVTNTNKTRLTAWYTLRLSTYWASRAVASI